MSLINCPTLCYTLATGLQDLKAVASQGGKPMEGTLALIEKLIEEHKVIIGKVQVLEGLADDASALAGLEESEEAFMPGRFDQKEGLQKMKVLLESVDEGLRAHFGREETALLSAFETHGDRKLVSDLESLLLEHEDLRNRFAHSKNHIAELTTGELARHRWEASAHDMRAHISYTRKLLQAHAAIERELLLKLREQLRQERKEK